MKALIQFGERDPEDTQALNRQMDTALQARTVIPCIVRAQQVPGDHDRVCWHEALLPGLHERTLRAH